MNSHDKTSVSDCPVSSEISDLVRADARKLSMISWSFVESPSCSSAV